MGKAHFPASDTAGSFVNRVTTTGLQSGNGEHVSAQAPPRQTLGYFRFHPERGRTFVAYSGFPRNSQRSAG